MMKKLSNSYFAYFLMYNFYFLSYSLFSTLISVYMLGKGFSASQVSLVVSASFLTSMLAQPIMGLLNDFLGIKKVTLASFLLIIAGAFYFMQAQQLWELVLGYSFVLMLINGVNPVMDVLAARSPYTYGKIRIWGTIGYAAGSQLAGLIYQYISPMAIYFVFIATMLLSIVGVLGVEIRHEKPQKKSQRKNDSYLSQILTNKPYLYYLVLVALYSGVGNTGHTYIPSMLEHSGLSVGMASTIVSLSVLCESPLIFYSYLFMDKFSSKTLLYLPLLLMLCQYVIYGLNLGLPSKIIMTLLAKHATGMLLIMISLKIVTALVNEKYRMTALALIQTVRSLGTIFIQNVAGSLLDNYGYEQMNLFLAAIILLVLVLAAALKVPRSQDKLFS